MKFIAIDWTDRSARRCTARVVSDLRRADDPRIETRPDNERFWPAVFDFVDRQTCAAHQL